MFTDRGQGFYTIKGGRITHEYKAALEEHELKAYNKEDASLQPGSLQEVMLHETAVAWVRNREKVTQPREPWKETTQEFAARLRIISQYINDHYGHAEGDRILKWVGEFLKGKLRQQDVCCRLGGDEFVALLPEADSEGCHRLMDRIGAALEKTDGDFPIPVRLSMGGITYPDDGTRASELLEAADQLMYRNKRANKLCPESIEFTQSRNRFLGEVRQVVLSGE